MSVSVTFASIAAPGFDEEVARAEIYGLLAQLYYAPPPSDLLAQLRAAPRQAPDQGGFLEASWQALAACAAEMGDDAVRAEYDALFGGVGKPDIYLFASHYLTGFLNEKPLVGLRDDLAALGLRRDAAMSETEDHIAYLCEVMRYLIAGDDVAVANLTQQRQFHARHLRPWIADLCDAIAAHPAARFYGALAEFTRAFFSVEAQAFDMMA